MDSFSGNGCSLLIRFADMFDIRQIYLEGEHKISHQLSGKGVSVLMIDSGIGRTNFFNTSRFTNLSFAKGFIPATQSNSHACRILSLVPGKLKNEINQEGDGIAPLVNLYSLAYPAYDTFENLLNEVVDIHEKIAPLDLIGIPFSNPETSVFAFEGRTEFLKLERERLGGTTTIICAAGHDGPDHLRFPGTVPTVITVGVHDENRKMHPRSGTDIHSRKPELLVKDAKYTAYNEKGECAPIGGTSAAVAIVVGMASLWIEKLRNEGVEIRSNLIKAVLLASSFPCETPPFRIASLKALNENHKLFALTKSGQNTLSLRFSGVNVQLCIGVANNMITSSFLNVSPELEVTLSWPTGIKKISASNWIILDDWGVEGEEYKLDIKTNSYDSEIAVTLIGANEVQEEKEPQLSDNKPLKIIGISSSHNASACLTVDGVPQRSIQLERISRIKHDGVPFLKDIKAVDYCLESLGVQRSEVDFFAFNSQPLIPNWVGLSQPLQSADFDLFDPFGVKSIFVSHHLAHALAAHCASPFDRALVVIADGSGGSTIGKDDLILEGKELEDYLKQKIESPPAIHCFSVYLFEKDSWKLIDREYAASFNVRCGSSSAGEVYAAVSQFVFGDWKEGGKLMGLAPYGNPENEGPSYLETGANGKLQFSSDWKQRFQTSSEGTDPMDFKDLAARVQTDFVRLIKEKIESHLTTQEVDHLVFSGGLSLNCVLNQELTSLVKGGCFFFPAANDAGIAHGAAAAAFYKMKGELPAYEYQNDYGGHPYVCNEIKLAIRAYQSLLSVKKLNIEEVAAKLVQEKIIGWFEGGSEFGPRALGHRSILAAPDKKEMWDRINQEVKFREDFRPLAPMVPEELASRYFEMTDTSPFMLRVVPVRKEWKERLRAICHVDGTARVQTVSKLINPKIHQLLIAFGEQSGIPILINTSMNCRGQVMIETPQQAIEFLIGTGLDELVMEDQIIKTQTRKEFQLTREHYLQLTPDIKITKEIVDGNHISTISSASFPTKPAIFLPEKYFNLVCEINKEHSIGVLLDKYLHQEYEKNLALGWLSSLVFQNYFIPLIETVQMHEQKV